MLAELVLQSASAGGDRDEVEATTFVFDMNKVFEDFVTVALGEEIERVEVVAEVERGAEVAGAVPAVGGEDGLIELDVEGAEAFIMDRFNYSAYRFRALSIERPKARLRQALVEHGYRYLCDNGG